MFLSFRELWDTRYIKTQLATSLLSEGKAFAYFFLIIVFDWVQFTLFRLTPTFETLKPWEKADSTLTLAITVFGLFFFFLRNGGNQGKDFLYRYFPLAFVVGWKFLLGNLIVNTLVSLILKNEPPSLNGWSLTLISLVINVIMFIRIGQHLKDLKNNVHT